jgi:dipeptidyl aminopeptidase/acylaminoacyl peptidase
MTTRWERRFRAPMITYPDWSPAAPRRLAYESTESGIWQLHVVDLDAGVRRRVTDHPVGVISGAWSPDGADICWWQDETGDESGRWYTQPFEGGEPRLLFPELDPGWNEGIAWVPGMLAVSISGHDGFAIYVSEDGGATMKEVARSTEHMRVAGRPGGYNRGGLSADGTLLCLQHAEHGDEMHEALRVIDPRTGATVADLVDGGKQLLSSAWSPIVGDRRLAVVHERKGIPQPALWDPISGEMTDVSTGLEGEVSVADWWPDAGALLLSQLHDGRHRLHRLDLETNELWPVEHPEGQVEWAQVRPDGSVWLRHASGASPQRILDDAGREVLPLEGEAAPAGRPYRSFRFDNRHGDSVQGFIVTPEGAGPWPILIRPHGGPTWLDEDRWNPEVQSYVDAGFAVAAVNYRGSTGRGAEWRDALIGDIGGPELEDLNDALDHLIAEGVADPDRAVVGGWSWGGYLTLMMLGKHPERSWRCGIAGIPVGDYELSYEDMSPLLQAYDRALLGGRPDEVPELMAERNPINSADDVEAPVLFLIGEHDSRCPLRQAMAYVDRLAARGHPHELYLFSTGHGSHDIDEEISQQRVILDFLAEHVPGVAVPQD